MTISDTSPRVQYTGTGADTVLNVTFTFDAAGDLEVIKRTTATGTEATLVSGTHYTVAGGSGSTGTVTPIDGATDFPSTVTWLIRRAADQDQTLDLRAQDSLPAASVEDALDHLARLVQEVQEQVDRCLKIPKTDATSLTTEIDNSVDRASKVFSFDASGNASTLSQLDQSAQTVVSSSGTKARSLAARFDDSISVIDHGAVGNGVTDDTAAIQAAATAALNTGKDVVFPAGEYLITDDITFDGCNAVGTGFWDFDNHDTEGSVIRVTGSSNPAFNIGPGVQVRNLVFHYPGQSAADATPDVFPATLFIDSSLPSSGASSPGFVIADNVFINCYHCIDLGGTTTSPAISYITRNRATPISRFLTLPNTTEALQITDNELLVSIWFESASQPMRDWIADNCVAFEFGGLSTSSVAGIMFTGNQIFGYNVALWIRSQMSQTVIQSNMIDGCETCILVDGDGYMNGVLIANNYIAAFNWLDATVLTCRAIKLDATATNLFTNEAIIDGNYFSPANGSHIEIDDGGFIKNNRLTISNNSFFDTKKDDTSSTEVASILATTATRTDLLIHGNHWFDATNSTHMIAIKTKCRWASIMGNNFWRVKFSIDADLVSGGLLYASGNRSFQTPATSSAAVKISNALPATFQGNQWDKETTSVAATATVTLPDTTNFVTITDTADITSITASYSGRVVTLLFSGASATNGIRDGSNLILNNAASDFRYNPDDTMQLVCDGTNWYEIARSDNSV